MRFLVRSSALALLLTGVGAGFFSNPARVANFGNWEATPIGAVWSDNFNRAALGTNWILLGGVNASIATNQLVFDETDIATTRQAYYQPWLLCSDQWTIQWSQRFEALTANSWGVGVGIKNFQAAGGNDRNFSGLLLGAGPDLGRMAIQRQDGTALIPLASGAPMVLTAGQTLDCSLTRSGWAFSATASNRANGQVSSATFKLSPPLLTPTISRVCCYPLGGRIYLDDLSYTINHKKPARYIIVGASISEGYTATAYEKSYRQVIQSNFTESVCNDSSSFNTTSNSLSALPEILAHRPGTVVLKIGSNDLYFGYPASQWQTQYASLAALLRASGIRVRHCLPLPRNNVDVTPLVSWIYSNYPSNEVINTWTPFLQGAHSLNPAYDSGDGVHPNDAGHLLLGQIIRTNLP
jgi:lysophospholipase L1-like esterase